MPKVAASAALTRVLERAPAVVLTEGGSPIDLAALTHTLTEKMAELERRPVIGLLSAAPSTQLLLGWALAEPLIDETSAAAAEFVAMTNHNANEFALWGVNGAGGVRRLWTVPNDMATLIRIDDAVYLGRMEKEGVVIEKLDLAFAECGVQPSTSTNMSTVYE